MRTVRRSLTEDAAKTMVQSFVTSRIDYCNSVIYGPSAVHSRPMQNALNAAARLVSHKRKFDHVTVDVRDRLHWLALQQRVEYDDDGGALPTAADKIPAVAATQLSSLGPYV